MTSSKEKLVVLFYEAGIRELQRALTALRGNQNSSAAGEALGKAFSIVAELKAALDMDAGGEIATNLDGLYTFVQGRITQANRERMEQPIIEAIDIMRKLKEGWDGILVSA